MPVTKQLPAGRKRRSYTKAERQKILAEASQPGVSMASIARRYGMNDNLLYTWRKRLREPAGRMVPVSIDPVPRRVATSGDPIEVRTAQGHVIKIGAQADLALVQAVLAALR